VDNGSYQTADDNLFSNVTQVYQNSGKDKIRSIVATAFNIAINLRPRGKLSRASNHVLAFFRLDGAIRAARRLDYQRSERQVVDSHV
jgi:hypothetical protein